MRSFASRLSERRSQTEQETPGGTEPFVTRPAGLEVIGAGFGRTGTMSLKLALERLGFGPCYHMTELVKNRSHPRLWRAAAQGDPVNWDRLYERYRSTVDWPGCLFYRELMAAYPAAKVLLTVRDPDRWYASVRDTLYSLKTATDEYLAEKAKNGLEASRKHFVFYENRIWEDLFGGRFDDRDHTIEVFQRHIADVQHWVPADRLLVYQVREGWEPLCRFLQVPVPDEAFPHLNDTAAFRAYNQLDHPGPQSPP